MTFGRIDCDREGTVFVCVSWQQFNVSSMYHMSSNAVCVQKTADISLSSVIILSLCATTGGHLSDNLHSDQRL